jgi:hypothetical protein
VEGLTVNYVIQESKVSAEGLKIAILDSERQRVAAARRAVDLQIRIIMVEQIAPLLAKRDELEMREVALDADIAPLLEQVVYRNPKKEF